MPSPKQWASSSARSGMYAALRAWFSRNGFAEVETPALVPAPGMELHITAFETPFVPETPRGRPGALFLHTSPEYAMKRLLADGAGPIFQICKVFRNGEISLTHNPEFTLLELYRPHSDYRAMMADVEGALAAAGGPVFERVPYERLTVQDALWREAGVDLRGCQTADALARAAGVRAQPGDSFDDVFFRVFLEKVEPKLGQERPTFLMDYPASMAALSRVKPQDPAVAERFELYAQGMELANGFSELNDAVEQRRRLVAERAERAARGRPTYPLDERFLEAVGRMPPSSGVAVGLDRVLMLKLGVTDIADVLLFPTELGG